MILSFWFTKLWCGNVKPNADAYASIMDICTAQNCPKICIKSTPSEEVVVIFDDIIKWEFLDGNKTIRSTPSSFLMLCNGGGVG